MIFKASNVITIYFKRLVEIVELTLFTDYSHKKINEPLAIHDCQVSSCLLKEKFIYIRLYFHVIFLLGNLIELISTSCSTIYMLKQLKSNKISSLPNE